MSNAMLGDLIFSITVLVLMTYNRVSITLLRDRIEVLEKQLAIKPQNPKDKTHHPLPLPNEPAPKKP